jgi:hypothetical protein
MLKRRLFTIILMGSTLLSPIASTAQTAGAPRPSTRPVTPPAVAVQPTEPAGPARVEQAVPKVRGRDVNLQVELTITDQTGTAPGEKKTVSMVIADATFGRIRSTVRPDHSYLNVDARPRLLDGDRILLELTVEYTPALPSGGPTSRYPAALNQSLSLILQNGKPMSISQAADPAADRRMTVDVRASVIK